MAMNKPWDAVVWWEVRRIPYNLALLVVGTGSVAAIELIGGRLVRVGEDFVEPLFLLFGIIAYAILANICYSLGWITELIWSSGDTDKTQPVRARVFRWGFLFSVTLTALPAGAMILFWAVAGFK